MNDRIEKTIELKAPVERVWRALTDHREFGQWFQVILDSPFVVGEVTRGTVTYPGYTHLHWQAEVESIEPQTQFSFTWYPYEDEAEANQQRELATLVEFLLAPTAAGTRLHITESGFSKQPDEIRAMDAFRRNTDGWNKQAQNIAGYVES